MPDRYSPRAMEQLEPREPADILRRLNVSEQLVREHVFRPDNVRDAVTGIDRFGPEIFRPSPPSGFLYHLDIEGFASSLHTLLSPCVVGYSMQLRRNGKTVLSRQWDWAKTAADGGVSWTANVPMHVASVSKLITAIAMTRLLRDRNISANASIADWLPAYWNKGHHVNRITFRHLLTHTSGLNFNGTITPSDFAFMRAEIARGTTNLGNSSYQNVNFALCRILISTISGAVPTGATFNVLGPALNDAYWDVATINGYRQYVVDNVFAPAGVTAPTLDHPAANALAYSFPVMGSGWDSGDLSTMSGGIAWHISTDDLLDVMGAFRRSGAILPPGEAEVMLDDGFGIDVTKDTSLGRIYAKGGFWGNGTQFEQANAFFLPKGMEMAVLCNSPFCSTGRGFMNEVTKAIEDNIKPNRVTITTGVAGGIIGALGLGARIRARRRFP